MNRNWSSSGRILAIALATMILSTTAFAAIGSFSAPSWRGNSNATFQRWSFSDSNKGPLLPDEGYKNDFKTPQNLPLLRVYTTADWDQGAWPVTDEIDIKIPNRLGSEPGSYKEIWLWLAWKGDDMDPFKWEDPMVSIATKPSYTKYEMTRMCDNVEGDWTNTLFKIDIWPNPSQELIALKGDILVDQVSVDTICIPEPATLGLLIGGALMAIRRRRKV